MIKQSKPIFRFSTLSLWLFACAVTPVLGNIWAESWVSSFGKKYVYADLLNSLLFIGIFTIPPVIAFANYFALSRLSKKAFFGKWLGVYLVTIVLAMVASEYPNKHVAYFHFQGNLRSLSSISWLDYVYTSHWLLVFAISALSTLLTYSLVSYLLAKVSDIKWRYFIIAAFVAVFLSEFFAQVFDLLGFNYLGGYPNRWDLAVKSWSGRIYLLCGQALSGVFWGYVSYATLGWLVARDFKSLVSSNKRYMIVSGSIILSLMAVLEGATNPYLVKLAYTNMARAITIEPKKDTSTGQAILQFAHTAEVVPPQYPVLNFSPDSKSFVMLDNKRTLQRIDVETGKSLDAIGLPIGGDERQERVWSVRGKYFAYRTSGEKVTVNKGYTRYRSKFQLYDTSSYQLLNEYTHRIDECFDTFDTSLAFEGDTALWVICAQEFVQQKPENVMAIKLSLPSMQVAEVRRYGGFLAHHNITGIASDAGHVYAWQGNVLNDNKNMLIHDLSSKNPPVVLPDLTVSHLAGSLTKQYESLKNGVMSILFCGYDSQVSDPSAREIGEKTVHGFCRTLLFDVKTGNLIAKKDDANRKRLASADEVEDVENQRLIQSTWQPTSGTGKIIVRDLKTGKTLQEIETVAQQRLKLSPNNHWLVSHAQYKNEIYIYRIN